jgi:glycosidase
MENEAFNYISKLLHFRKNSSAIITGKTMQYIAKDSAYVYFRYDTKQTIMVVTNVGNKEVIPNWNIYSERTSGFSKIQNVITGEIMDMKGFMIKPKESFVFELQK